YERQCIQIRNGVKEYSWDINDVANEQFKSFFPDAFEIDIQNYVSSLKLDNFKNAETETEGEFLAMIHQDWLEFDQFYQTLKSKVNQKKLQQHVQEAIEKDCDEKEHQRKMLHGNENQNKREKYFNKVRRLGLDYYLNKYENAFGDSDMKQGMVYIRNAISKLENIYFEADFRDVISSDLMEYWLDHGFGRERNVQYTIFLDLFGFPAEKTNSIRSYSDLEVIINN
ncbi:MAG: hypothetical protein GY870_02425, partial [archaeon]|nr:hypothetical protein [archaeon]